MKRNLSIILTSVCLAILATACQSKPTLSPGRYSLSDSYVIVLDLLPGGEYFLNGHEHTYLTSGNYQIDNDQITFTNKTGDCANIPGAYNFSFQDRFIKFKEIKDPCAKRLLLLIQESFIKLRQQNPYAKTVNEIPIENLNYFTVDSDGNIFITDGKASASKFDSNGNLLLTWGNLDHPNGIIVDSQGFIFIANFENLHISKFSPDGEELVNWQVLTNSLGPTDVGLDNQGNIFILLNHEQDHYVEKFTSDGKNIASWAGNGRKDGQVSGMFNIGPFQLAVDTDGNNYVTDPDNNRVVKFDPNGVFRYNLKGDADRQLAQPDFAAVDSSGFLYVLDRSQTIWKFDPDGKVTSKWASPYWGPIKIDKNGFLYVGDWNRIAKLDLPKP